MARKKFDSDKGFLESMEELMSEALTDTLKEDSPLIAAPTTPKRKRKSRRGTKNFADNLSSFLEDTLNEAIQEKVSELKTDQKRANKRKNKKPVIGLDTLIRRTVESSKVDISQGPTRRVTLVFDQTKIEKLKTIARMEKSYLRDVLDGLVSEYISEYETKKGDLGDLQAS